MAINLGNAKKAILIDTSGNPYNAIKYTTTALPPAVTDIAAGQACIHVDSNTGKVYIAYNKAGAIKKVELT